MNRPKTYNLRLSDEEWAKLKAKAEQKQITPAEVLRDFIKKL
jgi:predicted DNA-binding protein